MKSASHCLWTISWATAEFCSFNQFFSLPAKSLKYGSSIARGIFAGLAYEDRSGLSSSPTVNSHMNSVQRILGQRKSCLWVVVRQQVMLFMACWKHVTPKFSKGRTPLKVCYSMLHKAKCMHIIQHNFWLQDQCYLHKIQNYFDFPMLCLCECQIL